MQFLANYVQHCKSNIFCDTVLQRECALNRKYLSLIFPGRLAKSLQLCAEEHKGKN